MKKYQPNLCCLTSQRAKIHSFAANHANMAWELDEDLAKFCQDNLEEAVGTCVVAKAVKKFQCFN